MITQPESPETIFSLLYGRFPHADRLAAYDNGCKLGEYCLNREPHYFKRTIIVSDVAHHRGHIGCTRGHSIGSYWWAAATNSEACEQGNSSTAKVRTQTAFMTIEHFTLYMRFYISAFNVRKLTKMRHDLRHSPAARVKMTELKTVINYLKKQAWNIVDDAPCHCELCQPLP
jgi:hypothetical protein